MLLGAFDDNEKQRLGHRYAVVAVHDGVAAVGGYDADRRDHLAALLGHPQALPTGAGALRGGAEVGVELGGAVRLDRRVNCLDRDLPDGVEVRRGAVARVMDLQLHAFDAPAAFLYRVFPALVRRRRRELFTRYLRAISPLYATPA